MIRLPLVLAATIHAALGAPTDLLRLTNGELEGRFAGLDATGVLKWERDDGVAPLQFKTDKVRQIILRGGHPTRLGTNTSFVSLTNGDRIPGTLTGLDGETLSLDTEFAGPLVIARDRVTAIAPNPFGGRLVYAGPFSADGWEVLNPGEISDDDEENEEEEDESDDDEVKAPEPAWRHIGSKWYYTGGPECLRLDAGMPDRALLRFKLEWRSRPPISIAFHADFAGPPEPSDEEDGEGRRRSGNNLSDCFGTAYVLNLRSSYATLHHCGFNEEGEPYMNQIRASATNLRLQDTGEAILELRCDRTEGIVAFHINGEFAMQWSLADPDLPEDESNRYHATGGGIGFQISGRDNPVRISDLIIAEWNGMPDSARSLQSDKDDIVLLTNGTDRFSGKVTSVEERMLELEGRYAQLRIPLEEIAEVHFARDSLHSPESPAEREVRIHFQPIGRLSGIPGSATPERFKLRSPLLGDLTARLDSATIVEFQSGSGFLNYWDEDL